MIIARNLIDVKSIKDVGVCCIEEDNEIQSLSYNELYTKAVKKLKFYRECGIKPKDKVFLVHGHTLSIMVSFWACLLGGMVAVPIGKNPDYLKRVVKTVYIKGDFFSIDKGDSFTLDEELGKSIGNVISISDEELEVLDKDESLIYTGEDDDIIYIMYSSGTTDNPKGIAHTNRTVSEMLRLSEDIINKCGDSYVSLFPIIHTAGLVLNCMYPLKNHANQIFISLNDASSVKSIRKALDCITKYKGTCFSMPPSLLNLCTEIIRKDENCSWDLSSLKTFLACSEMVSSSSIFDFYDAIGKVGNENNVVMCLYGSTETAGPITSTPYIDRESIIATNTRQLSIGTKINIIENSESNMQKIVPVGYPKEGVEIRIVGMDGNELKEDYIGKVMIRGKSIPLYYYNSNVKIINENRFYDVGDVGFIHNKQIYIVGRMKDIISIHGKKVFCSEIEQSIEQLLNLKAQTVKLVPTLSFDESNDMLCFWNYTNRNDFNEKAEQIWKYCYEKYFINILSFIMLENFPKTESGKIIKYKMAQLYLDGYFEPNYQYSVSMKKDVNNSIEQIEDTVYELIYIATGNYPDREGTILQSGISSLQVAKICVLLNKQFGEVVNEVDIYDYYMFSQLVNHIYNALKGD